MNSYADLVAPGGGFDGPAPGVFRARVPLALREAQGQLEAAGVAWLEGDDEVCARAVAAAWRLLGGWLDAAKEACDG